ncbi:MAG: DUF421 domain-containing protein [Alphaproteobacteria bacterium]|nr:DUF421 domain-containing protein [Alphaproteobacteria bacterium]MBU0795479.1 DUF421 domain-containing protein [Alphaproteobacteria bacterium]MBU0875352.1 DUF421 domain-containing protein [Alphaproteobacteria bacterium]MBU1771282.1 DUF421 domain-containing protein [Alphaproteobacteria bacterium]
MDSVLRGAAIYCVVLIIVRLTGRRALAQMTPFDLVLLLIVAETTQQALLGDDFSVANAAILIVTLFTIDIGLSYIKEYWPTLEKVMDGRPTLLIGNGRQDERALARARISLKDVMMAGRSQHGLERLDQIKHAILETDGNISIIPAKSD